jgi:hypothetical protein
MHTTPVSRASTHIQYHAHEQKKRKEKKPRSVTAAGPPMAASPSSEEDCGDEWVLPSQWPELASVVPLPQDRRHRLPR